jgi:hypothetical protein
MNDFLQFSSELSILSHHLLGISLPSFFRTKIPEKERGISS